MQTNDKTYHTLSFIDVKRDEKETYSVVVESGSFSPDGKRWEELRRCGHKHRTKEAAQACKDKLTQGYCQHGKRAGHYCKHCHCNAPAQYCDGNWYNTRIHNQHGERADREDCV